MIKNILKTLKEVDDKYDPIILKVIELVKGKTGLSDQRIAPVLVKAHLAYSGDEKKIAMCILKSLLSFCEKEEQYELCAKILEAYQKLKNIK